MKWFCKLSSRIEVILKDYCKEQRSRGHFDGLSWRKKTRSRISKHWRHFRGRLNMQTEQAACVSFIWLSTRHSFYPALQHTVVEMIPYSFFFCLSQCAIYTAWWFGQILETARWRPIDHRPSGKRTGNIWWNVLWSGWGHPHAATQIKRLAAPELKIIISVTLQGWKTYTSLCFFLSSSERARAYIDFSWV